MRLIGGSSDGATVTVVTAEDGGAHPAVPGWTDRAAYEPAPAGEDPDVWLYRGPIDR
ncbi:hypothetical protein [Streptosporangium sandarakinum]|uniref:hypothetical protein n=1 Tax=Streptosporangium sandarakinum TaxID=1260955 RepID=UPI0033A7AF38